MRTILTRVRAFLLGADVTVTERGNRATRRKPLHVPAGEQRMRQQRTLLRFAKRARKAGEDPRRKQNRFTDFDWTRVVEASRRAA